MEVGRFWELDFLRGVAVILMITFNYIFALNFLGIIEFPIYSFFWQALARITAGIFFFLVGCCMWISWSRAINKYDKRTLWKKYVIKAGKIFSLGLLITLVTWLFLKYEFVKFGALHFIGVSILLLFLLLRLKVNEKVALGIAITIILVGIFFENLYVDFEWMFWLGLKTKNFSSLDYFPLFPWFGIPIIGLVIGKILYSETNTRFSSQPLPKFCTTFFCFLGKNSLTIYLLHQPFLLLILQLLGFPIFYYFNFQHNKLW
jgi:uncharacterized membrane protein